MSTRTVPMRLGNGAAEDTPRSAHPVPSSSTEHRARTTPIEAVDDWTVGFFDDPYTELFPFPDAAQTDYEVDAS
jgi:hypothetical protein